MVTEMMISVILLVVGIAVLVVIHVCIVGRAFRGDPNNGTGLVRVRIDRIPSMKAEDIKELPCFDYKVEVLIEEKGISNRDQSCCAVCLENFRGGEKCRMLPKCNHSFHVECIDSWLLKTAACPICRTAANLCEQQLQPNIN